MNEDSSLRWELHRSHGFSTEGRLLPSVVQYCAQKFAQKEPNAVGDYQGQATKCKSANCQLAAVYLDELFATMPDESALKGHDVIPYPLETKISYAYGSKNANTPQGKLTQQMRAKLQTKEGRMIYNRRFYTVESVFGTIKAARDGFQFLRRGLDRVQVEWTERCIAHNIAKLIGFSQLALV